MATTLHTNPVNTPTKPPSEATVILLNDDDTPMELVLALLTSVFLLSVEDALRVTLSAHKHGKSIVRSYPSRDIADTKVAQATKIAQQHEHPLRFIVQ